MSRELVTKGGRFYCVSLQPDICKTPIGASTPAIPYTIKGEFVEAEGVSTSITSNGEKVVINASTVIPRVTGDEAGTAKGVKSGTVAKRVQHNEKSSTVTFNGERAIRVGDVVFMNDKNTIGKIFERGGGSAAQTGVPVAGKIAEVPKAEISPPASWAAGDAQLHGRDPKAELFDKILGRAGEFGNSGDSKAILSTVFQLARGNDIKALALKSLKVKAQAFVGSQIGATADILPSLREHVGGLMSKAHAPPPTMTGVTNGIASAATAGSLIETSVLQMVEGLVSHAQRMSPGKPGRLLGYARNIANMVATQSAAGTTQEFPSTPSELPSAALVPNGCLPTILDTLIPARLVGAHPGGTQFQICGLPAGSAAPNDIAARHSPGGLSHGQFAKSSSVATPAGATRCQSPVACENPFNRTGASTFGVDGGSSRGRTGSEGATGIPIVSRTADRPLDTKEPRAAEDRTFKIGKKTFVIKGGTNAQQIEGERALREIFGTKRGAQMLKELESRRNLIFLEKEFTIDMRVRDNAYAYFGRDAIYVDPNYTHEIDTTQGRKRMTMRRFFAHELGHSVFSTADRGPNRMDNVLQNENPIMVELGEPARTKYE